MTPTPNVAAPAPHASLRRAPRKPWIPWFILGVGLLGTALATAYARHTARMKDAERFTNSIERTIDTINDRIDAYLAVLQGCAAYFESENINVSKTEFHAYVARLNVPGQYPGFQGIGVCARVRASQLEGWTDRLRRAGVTQLDRSDLKTVLPFTVWPVREGVEELFPIIYLEPLEPRNHSAVGYDMFENTVRAEAMTRARDTGAPAVSGIVKLLQEIQGAPQPGFLIYVPVYRGGGVPGSIEERREKLIGFVYAPFRADDLFMGLFGSQRYPRLHLQVFDGESARTESLLHHSDRVTAGHDVASDYVPRFEEERRLPMLGRTWTVAFETRPEFEIGSTAPFVPWVALAGGVISGMLFGAARVQARARTAAEESARQRAELLEREQHARREAEHANRLKDEFLASVSHELRTPLNAILGWSQLLHMDGADGERDDEALASGLEAIERNARAQAKLIEDLLDVSRIVSGKLRLDVRDVDLASVIAAAVETVRPAAEAKGIRLDVRMEDGGASVRGDATRLQQVAWNLLSNAIKFTPERGMVEIRLERSPGAVSMTVSDTGQGIEAGFLPHVFDAFRQADASTTRRHGGLGLGLAIVRHLVELHGGRVTAHSEGTGRGARFVVSLPARPADAAAARPDEASDAPPPTDRGRAEGAFDRLHGVHVLLVDDEADTRQVALRALEQAGATVAVAADVGGALAAFDQRVPDVLVSDLSMPDEDGYELIRRIRGFPAERGRDVPAIALSALARPEDRQNALAAGYQVHVAKPVEPAELRRVVAQVAGVTTGTH